MFTELSTVEHTHHHKEKHIEVLYERVFYPDSTRPTDRFLCYVKPKFVTNWKIIPGLLSESYTVTNTEAIVKHFEEQYNCTFVSDSLMPTKDVVVLCVSSDTWHFDSKNMELPDEKKIILSLLGFDPMSRIEDDFCVELALLNSYAGSRQLQVDVVLHRCLTKEHQDPTKSVKKSYRIFPSLRESIKLVHKKMGVDLSISLHNIVDDTKKHLENMIETPINFDETTNDMSILEYFLESITATKEREMLLEQLGSLRKSLRTQWVVSSIIACSDYFKTDTKGYLKLRNIMSKIDGYATARRLSLPN
jgi:hypothetical protein